MIRIEDVESFLLSAECPVDLEHTLEVYVCEEWGDAEQQEWTEHWSVLVELPRPLTLQQAVILEAFQVWDGWYSEAEARSLEAAECYPMESYLDGWFHRTHGDY